MAGSDSRANSPQQILQYNVIIRNYAGDTTDLTSMVTQFNIYESIFKRTTSADIVVSDAVGFTNRLPIVGDEHLIITYRSARLKKTITRSFKVYKVGTRKEGAQRQENYIIHAISEYAIFNEMRSIDKSFASQKTSEAIKNAFANGFRGDVGGVDGSSILGTKNLYGLKKDDIVESESVTSFIPPGLSPFECINYLKNECRHPEPNNNSDYIFFEDVDGFHFTTMKELKDQKTAEGMRFLLGDQSHVTRDQEFDVGNIIVSLSAKKTVDRLQDLGTGMFRNRVAVVDPLTKKYDSRTFIYFNEFGTLNRIHEFPARTIARNSQYRFIQSSTHTRFMAGELNTTALNTSVAPAFTPRPGEFQGGVKHGDVDNYMDHPYIKNVDKQVLINKDPHTSNPQKGQIKLGKKISERAILDNTVLEMVIPGNSDIRPGDMVEVYVPQTTSTKEMQNKFNLFYGRSDSGKFAPRFLATSIRQTYNNSDQNFLTAVELMKDTYAQEIEDIYQRQKESFNN